MKNYARAIFLLVIGISVSTFAQNGPPRISATDMYLISAKAGGVNFTEGAVTVIRADGKSGVLLKGDQIEIDDRVSTGADGRIEILLNPGSYLRLGSNSSLEFNSTSLDDLQISMESGSAVFEVFATDKFRVNVSTRKEKLAMFESGIYRIDLRHDGSGTISVTEGKAVVGRVASLTLVTSGKMATFGAGAVTVAKFDRGKRDDLAQWSKSRAKDLAKMTASLNNSNMRNTLSRSFNSGRWNLYDSFGLWVYDPFRRSFCFMPFGRNWYSPYGHDYGAGIINNYPTGISLHKDPKGTPIPVGNGSRITKLGGPPPFTQVERQQKTLELRRSEFGDNGSFFPGSDRREGSSPTGRIFSSDGGRQTSEPLMSAPGPIHRTLPSKDRKPIDQ